jgi:hypothetical protein
MSKSKKFDLEDKDLLFLDVQMQWVLDSLKAAQEVAIQDRSLTIQEVLTVNPTYEEDINLCDGLIARVQEEIRDRGIG